MKLRHKKMARAAARASKCLRNWLERGGSDAYWNARMWHFKFSSIR